MDSFQHIILRLLNIDDDDAPHLDKDCDCVDEVATGDQSDGAWPAEHRQSLTTMTDVDNNYCDVDNNDFDIDNNDN